MSTSQPTPLNARQDAFCRLVASGLSIAQAARDAGFTPLNAPQIGAELWAHPAAQKRIAEYAAAFAAERKRVLDEAQDQLDEIAACAMAAGQFRTALRATEVKLRMLGLDAPGRLDRSEEDRHIIAVHKAVTAKKAAMEAAQLQPAPPQPAPPQPAPPAMPLEEIRAKLDAALKPRGRKPAPQKAQPLLMAAE